MNRLKGLGECISMEEKQSRKKEGEEQTEYFEYKFSLDGMSIKGTSSEERPEIIPGSLYILTGSIQVKCWNNMPYINYNSEWIAEPVGIDIKF